MFLLSIHQWALVGRTAQPAPRAAEGQMSHIVSREISMEKPVHFCTDRLLPSDRMRFQSTVRRSGGLTRHVSAIATTASGSSAK